MPNSALHKLQSFHQELYQHAIQATQHITSMNTAEIAAYSQNFQASLPGSFQPSDAHQLVMSIASADFMLFGDFHTLKQSQRGFLRILEQIQSRHPERPLMVALEIFNAEDQPMIDEYLQGVLPEDQFLRRIDYHNKWGFPWENYRPIVAFCAKHNIQICGINSQFDSPNRLIRRDEFAADILNVWAEKNPKHLCLCLIGEYHLADQHLIAYLKPGIKSVRVVNNIDEYAFNSIGLPTDSSDYLQLADNFFCVLNTAPWIKWQSLAMWEEFHSSWDGIPGDDFDPYTEQLYDFDYQLLHILKALNQFIGLHLTTTELSHFDLYIRPDKATSSYIKAKLRLSKAELTAAEKRCDLDGFAYFSPSATVILKDPSINRFAEISGFYFYDTLRSPRLNKRLNFMERVERQICGTLAAMIMNPRRPALTISEADKILSQVKTTGRGQESIPTSQLESMFAEIMQCTGIDQKMQLQWDLADKNCELALSRQLGEVLGAELFQQIVHGDAARLEEDLRRIFQGDIWVMVEFLSPGKAVDVA